MQTCGGGMSSMCYHGLLLYVLCYLLLRYSTGRQEIASTRLFTMLNKGATGLRGSAVVLQAKAKAAELKEAGIEEAVAETEVNGTSTNSTQVKIKSLLTGIPQKDYIYDPNLPRELNGHNLTNYPFYNAVPPDIEFDCDGLHDGFYASVPHKCQVYHHCLFGTRYDFLCANYTAFDQKTFICHFVSEVDCQNSPKYYKRNEALYKAATTSPPPTTARPTTTSTTTTTTQAPPPSNGAPRNGPTHGHRPFRTRGGGRPAGAYRRRRPVYYYYYYDDDDGPDDGDYDFYDEPVERERQQPGAKGNRKQPNQGHGHRDNDNYKGLETQQATSTEAIKPSVRPSSSQSPASGSSVYDKPRVPPKIRRPVPINERDKYEYTQQTTDVGPAPTAETAKNKKTQQARRPVSYDDYYDDEEEDDYLEEQPPKYKKVKTSDYEAEPSTTSDSRRPVSSRHRLRVHSHRRPDRFDDDYEEEYDRFRKRKEPRNKDDYNSQRSSRFRNRGKYSRDEEAVPAQRPGYISGGRASPTSRRKPQNEYQRPPARKTHDRRPIYEDDDYEEYYDDDEVEDEKMPRRNNRNRQSDKRDEYQASDSKSDRRANNKEYRTNSDTRSTSSLKDIQSRSQSNLNSKSSNYNDSVSKETSQNKESKRSSNNKQVGIDNKKLSSSTTEKYASDEEYDDGEDYEEPKQTLLNRTIESFSMKEYNKPSQTQSNPNKNSNYQVNGEPPSADHSNVDHPKNTDSLSTAMPSLNNQEQSNYSRSPGLFRSRTSSASNQFQSVTTPMTSNHRFLSTSPDNNQDSDLNNRYKSDVRSKTVSTTPSNYYRKQSISPAVNEDNSEEISNTKPLRSSSSIFDSSTTMPSKEMTELSAYNIPSRSSAPSAVLHRRPLKSTSLNTIETTTSYSDATAYSSQRPVAAIGYRRIVKPIDSDDKLVRKEQAFPSTGFSGNFRRPVIKGTDSDRASQLILEQTNYDSTAPGPSAPEESLQLNNRNQNYRQNPTTNFDLNIPEEEYDVTLNDALQPSTLHPTRSLADYPIQARLKSRGYQSRVTHQSRGAASYLLPSASQQYVARVQTTRTQDKAVESEPSQSKQSSQTSDQEEYEAVVLSAPQYDTGSLHRWVNQQRQIRPAEWYW
ncbi:uncharacterized protein LOC111059008 isoform X1 [Nilaparvata lugens]|uniref:uncharacterized protein LOC111059008 isoform X1 n=1 Tax=Nilaparvata lugens TaxID=108931 RepID=UPI00193EB96F|nr:uncharacterized protein LOC111059008 isoform X1 [Nilaparvata lugens]